MSRQQTRKVIYAENNLPHAASNSVKLIVKMISFFSTLLVLYNKLIACKLHSFVAAFLGWTKKKDTYPNDFVDICFTYKNL